MKDLGFGMTMTLIGMGVTLLTLVLLGYVIRLLIKLFPYRKEDETAKDKK